MIQLIFILFALLVLLVILALFYTKAELQLRYLRLKKNPGKPTGKAFYSFSFSDKKARKERWEAFLMFPMLYPVSLDDKREELNEIKRKIKQIHIGIYLMLVLLIIMAVYSEKVFPS